MTSLTESHSFYEYMDSEGLIVLAMSSLILSILRVPIFFQAFLI